MLRAVTPVWLTASRYVGTCEKQLAHRVIVQEGMLQIIYLVLSATECVASCALYSLPSGPAEKCGTHFAQKFKET